jgi:hypothetical protein
MRIADSTIISPKPTGMAAILVAPDHSSEGVLTTQSLNVWSMA